MIRTAPKIFVLYTFVGVRMDILFPCGVRGIRVGGGITISRQEELCHDRKFPLINASNPKRISIIKSTIARFTRGGPTKVVQSPLPVTLQ